MNPKWTYLISAIVWFIVLVLNYFDELPKSVLIVNGIAIIIFLALSIYHWVSDIKKEKRRKKDNEKDH